MRNRKRTFQLASLFVLAAPLVGLVTGCTAPPAARSSPPIGVTQSTTVDSQATAHPEAWDALDPDSHAKRGPGIAIYSMPVNGFTDPNNGGSSGDPAGFNQLVYGTAVPPAANLVGSTSVYGGHPKKYAELTKRAQSDQFAGVLVMGCNGFANNTKTGNCIAAQGSTSSNILEFAAVQSWPFYVGAATSSNVPPGQFGFETSSDDGSYLVLAPAAFTYAQPADFQGTTGLVAGTALVQNGGAHGPGSRTGSVQIAAGNCAANLYWLTMEWYEILGGYSGISYNWTIPGASGAQQATQSVLWGHVTLGGNPAAGATIAVGLGKHGSANLVTDSNGCYGYNYQPFAGTQTVSVTATVNSVQQTQQAQITTGSATETDFAF
jgi:hypothetical protein